MTTPEPATVTEEDADRALTAVFSRVFAIRDALPSFTPALPLTPLAHDDARTGAHKGSTAAVRSISAAVEHLDVLHLLVMDARHVHPSAPFTLARAAIETASSATWLLAPPDHRERVIRALRHAARDARDGAQAATDAGAPQPRPLEARIAEMEELAAAVGHRGQLKSPSSTECVKAAEAAVESVFPVLLIWRLCSGFAHGRTWATLAWLEQEIHDSTDTDVRLKVTNSLDRVLMVTLTAVEVLDRALRLYGERNTSAFAQ